MRKTTTINGKLTVLLLGCVCLSSQHAIAEMYKWVDAEGNTNYTQSPPPGDIEKEVIKPPPKINSELSEKQLENRKKELNESRDSRLESKQQKKEQQQDLEKQRADCGKAKARLASYERPRVNVKDKDGNPARVPEEQRQKEIEKSKELVAKLCK